VTDRINYSTGKGVIVCPCSHCGTSGPSVRRKSGRVGITRTSFYRETILCKHCKVEVSAGTPGNAVAFWNRSFEASRYAEGHMQEARDAAE